MDFSNSRNEIANYFNNKPLYIENLNKVRDTPEEEYFDVCCFDRFVSTLPKIYKHVIELVYIKGLKQKDAAKTLGISLENVKARIKRSKIILKQNFKTCCKYDIDKHGNLIGKPDCSLCKPC